MKIRSVTFQKKTFTSVFKHVSINSEMLESIHDTSKSAKKVLITF